MYGNSIRYLMYVKVLKMMRFYRTNQPVGALCQSSLPIGYNFTT